MIITRLTVKEVEYIAFSLARELMAWDEPIPDFGTRFPNVLESCLAVPFQTFSKKRKLNGKAAILFYLMVKNHPFENGNKRIAVMTTLVFIGRNRKWLKVSNDGLYRIAVVVAESDPKRKDEYIKVLEHFFAENIISSP
ncbi:MAG: type II toxin-antitoxin system death-on-curing family toxin [bacterium]